VLTALIEASAALRVEFARRRLAEFADGVF
jgi:hypothetical protein